MDPNDLKAILTVAPYSSPGVAYGAASSSSPVRNIAAVTAFQEGMYLRDKLSRLDNRHQFSAWESMNEAQHSILLRMGYTPPHLLPDHRAWWQKTLGAIGGGIKAGITTAESAIAGAGGGIAVGTTLAALAAAPFTGGLSLAVAAGFGAAAGAAVGGAYGAARGMHKVAQGEAGYLSGFGIPYEDMKQVYRTTKLLARDASAGKNLWDWSVDEWAKKWRQAGDDIPDFFEDPHKALETMRIEVDPEQVDMAVDMVGGSTEWDLYGKYGIEKTQAAFGNPNFDKAFKALSQIQISPGRGLMLALGLKPLSKPFDLLSGSIDGTLAFFADPGMRADKGIKGIQGLRAMRHVVKDASSVDVIMKGAAGRRKAFRIAQHFQEGGRGLNGVLDEMPELRGLADDLHKYRPNTAEKVVELLKMNAGLTAVLDGRSANQIARLTHLPTLSRMKQFQVAVRQGWIRGFEKLEKATAEIPVLSKAAKAPRRLTYLIHVGTEIPRDNAPATVERLKALLRIGTTQETEDKIVMAWFDATAAGKEDIVEGAIRSAEASLGHNREIGSYLSEVLNRINQDRALRNAGIAGDDLSSVSMKGARRRNLPTTEKEISGPIQIPSFRAMLKAHREVAAWRQVKGIRSLPWGLTDRLIQGVWKPVVLLRLGFPLRVGGEEATRAILEIGIGRYARARLAGTAMKRMAYLAKRLNVSESEATFLSWVADKTSTAVGGLAYGLAGESYIKAAKTAAEMFGYDKLTAPMIRAGRDAAGFLDRGESVMVRIARGDGEYDYARMNPTKRRKGYMPGDQLHTYIRQRELAFHVDEPSMQIVLRNVDDRERGVRELTEYLGHQDQVGLRDIADRSRLTAYGKRVGVDITPEGALRDWAEHLYDSQYSLLQGDIGVVQQEIVDSLRKGIVPSYEELEKLGGGAVYGQEMIPVKSSSWEEIVNRGFGPLERIINWIAREPIFIHELAVAQNELRPILGMLQGVTAAEEKKGFLANPKVVPSKNVWFHGSRREFEQFATKGYQFPTGPGLRRHASGDDMNALLGAHFTDEYDVAAEFGNIEDIRGARLSIARPRIYLSENALTNELYQFGRDRGYVSKKGEILPEVSGVGGADWKFQEMKMHGLGGEQKERLAREFVTHLESRGYDGILYKNDVEGGNAAIVFHTRQIKSPVNHLPLFDAERVANERAVELAWQRMYPFIHRTEIRSQAAVALRNWMPFYHAHQQWLIRWGKTFLRTPTAARRAQLYMMGLRHAGVIHRDEETGEEYFIYPMTGFVQTVLEKAASTITGRDVSLPVPVRLTGRVKMLTPGLHGPLGGIAPSFGPLMAVSTHMMKVRFPEFSAQLEEAAEQRKVPLWEQLVPTTLTRLVKTFFADADKDAQLMSAINQAQLYLEANGQGLKENPTPNEKDEYQSRVQTWGRSFLLLRAIYGFVGPAAPQPEFHANLAKDFQRLLRVMPYEDALGEFIRRNPDGTPWTVFPTESLTDRVLNPDAQVGKWLRSNKALLGKYGAAAAWLIPPTQDKFDYNTYLEEFAVGLRRRRTPEELWKAVKVRVASEKYFPVRDERDAALAGAQNASQRRFIMDAWDAWKTGFFNTHPIFAEYLTSGGERARQRNEQIESVRQMLVDPKVPNVYKSPLLPVLEAYNLYQQAVADLGRTDAERKYKQQVRTALMAWGASLDNDVSRQFFRALILPDLE